MIWLVWKETLLLVTTGAVLGIAISIAAMHLATGLLYGSSPEDPQIISLAGLLLLMVSMAASFSLLGGPRLSTPLKHFVRNS
jgi:hypothetical protein